VGLSLPRKILLTVLVIAAVLVRQVAPTQIQWIAYVLAVVILVGIFLPPLNRGQGSADT
jgi:hypothetical protein